MEIDLRALRSRCRMHNPPGLQIASGLWYTDNQADVLGIAHLDYVPQTKHFDSVRILPGNNRIIYSGQLDNRLGVYTLLDVLTKFGCTYDVLLTSDEERCNSTARFFDTSKVYRWIFSFDRAGASDVALYQYQDDQTSKAVQSVGLRPAQGSYSDIVELGHLGCNGFNWCNGLVDGHSPTAHVSESVYLSCIYKFLHFWDLYSGTHFPHKPTVQDLWLDDVIDSCAWCGQYSASMEYIEGCWICPDCASGKWIDECEFCGRITTVEYQAMYDAWLCEPCVREIVGL